MADEGFTLRDINWRQAFPFTHLFRGFRIAIHPSKLFLALLAIGFLWCGGLILDSLWRNSDKVRAGEEPPGYQAQVYDDSVNRNNVILRPYELGYTPHSLEQPQGIFTTFFNYEVQRANNVLIPSRATAGPLESIWQFIAVGPGWLWTRHPLFALLYTALFLFTWSVFGGAIARIAAVHVARDEKISVRHALRFAANKILSFICAPLIPALIIFGIGIVISIVSYVLLHIPVVGTWIVGGAFILALLGGLVMTLVLLGTLGGYNLMHPTIAVEGSDSFDAISRSFSYVFHSPWRMLWYTLVSIVYGAICYLFVRFFVWLVLMLTWAFVQFGAGWFHGTPGKYFPAMFPPPIDPNASLPYSPDYYHLAWPERIGAGLITWWNYLLVGLVAAFVISYYFSTNTIMYFLMRREVDATEMDDVYVEETDDEFEEPAAAATATTDTAPGSAAPATVVTESTTVRVYTTSDAPAAGSETPATEPPAQSP